MRIGMGYDVHKLTEILQRLAEGGNTVIVIEHNLDVIKTADYIIDVTAYSWTLFYGKITIR